MKLNPFHHLCEVEAYPHSRPIWPSLFEQTKKIFSVFYGDIIGKKMGLLDYIYPLPRLLTIILLNINNSNLKNSKKKSSNILLFNSLFFLASTVTFFLSIPKIALASLLTVIASPIILSVHFYNKSKIKNIKLHVKYPENLIPNIQGVLSKKMHSDSLLVEQINNPDVSSFFKLSKSEHKLSLSGVNSRGFFVKRSRTEVKLSCKSEELWTRTDFFHQQYKSINVIHETKIPSATPILELKGVVGNEKRILNNVP